MRKEDLEKFIRKEFRLVSTGKVIMEPISEGMSGAEVYLLTISNAGRTRDNGNYILKIIDMKSQWFSKSNNEGHKAEKIYITSEKFRRHLVKKRVEEYIDDKLIIIYFYALKSRLSSISLEKNGIEEKCEILRNISFDLLEKFNYGTHNFRDTNGRQVLEDWLKYRIEKNGIFKTRINELLFSPEMPAFNYKGIILPNPLHYIFKLDKYINFDDFCFIEGKIHGDLHQKNIFTHKNGENYNYVIIDYDNFDEKNYLFFDHAYLELNVLDEELKELNLYDWCTVMQALMSKRLSSKQKKLGLDYIRCENVRDKICKGIIEWQKKNYPEMLDLIEIQFILSRIAAGINFMCKSAITDSILQTKYLIYAAINLEELFKIFEIRWDKEHTGLLREREQDSQFTEFIWEACDKFKQRYLKILLTDDNYSKQNYQEIDAVSRIEWNLIVDIGCNEKSEGLYDELATIIKSNMNFKYMENSKNIDTVNNNTCFWLNVKIRKNELALQHWIRVKNNIDNIIANILGNSPLKPVLFVFDCQKNSFFVNKMIESMLEENILKKGMRIVSLGNEPEKNTQKVLETLDIKQFYNKEAVLMDISHAAVEYGINKNMSKPNIFIPSIPSLTGEINKTELEFYESSIELVYDGLEKKEKNYDYGKSFYKGNEITWLDLEQRHDITFFDYNKKLKSLLEKLEKAKTPVYRLIHGAGAGGTTLSRRLMWDIKSTYPVARVRKYTQDTVNIISELYRKSGKCIFVVIEKGSTVISEEEFIKLVNGVNAQSCRALFLRVERNGNQSPGEIKRNKTDIVLEKDMGLETAEIFFNVYSKMTDDPKRKKILDCITHGQNTDKWGEQCCPFFYGFYTFQEEYEGVDHFLENTLSNCSRKITNILSDLSLVTLYSQNICISYEEMANRLEIENFCYLEIIDSLGESVIRIMNQRERGFRICHPLIAKKVLEQIYEGKNNRLYMATINYINRMRSIYGNEETNYIDMVFRELFIDRSYIDGEKQSFSEIIEDIPGQLHKKQVFEHLIKLYPENPHYYNHLGRLEAYEAYKNFKQFESAIAHLNRAIRIAEQREMDLTSHYTTLACIYSKKTINHIEKLRRDGKECSIERVLEDIRCDYENASEYFIKARKNNSNNTYGYFPNILMICNVVNYMVKYTRKDVDSLLKNKIFEEWYDFNIGKGTQLYIAMENNCEDEILSNLSNRAQSALLKIRGNIQALKNNLNLLERRYGSSKHISNVRRTVISTIYINNKYSWENLNRNDIHYIKDAMQKNMIEGNCTETDVLTWFNVYRQMEEFDPQTAIEYIEDYMHEGYYKEYVLWILYFWLYEKGLVTLDIVEKHLNACRKECEKANVMLRTSRFIDAYVNSDVGYPIQPFKDVKKDENDRFTNLREFKGTIVKIDGTKKGIILLDRLNLNVFFLPSFTDELGNKREFFSKHETKKVIFNLMFTYSGLRAWNVKLEE